jgi:outer membrane receptor for ferrienterochelin and colicins
MKKYDPYINVDKAEFKGVETSVDWRFAKNANLSAAYTYLQTVDKSENGQAYIEHRPKHKLDLRLNFTLPYRFHVNIDGSYVSSQIYYDDEEELSLDPYTLLNVKISKQLGKQWWLFLRIHNLFDANYYESEGFPREGRMISAGIRFTSR